MTSKSIGDDLCICQRTQLKELYPNTSSQLDDLFFSNEHFGQNELDDIDVIFNDAFFRELLLRNVDYVIMEDEKSSHCVCGNKKLISFKCLGSSLNIIGSFLDSDIKTSHNKFPIKYQKCLYYSTIGDRDLFNEYCDYYCDNKVEMKKFLRSRGADVLLNYEYENCFAIISNNSDYRSAFCSQQVSVIGVLPTTKILLCDQLNGNLRVSISSIKAVSDGNGRFCFDIFDKNTNSQDKITSFFVILSLD